MPANNYYRWSRDLSGKEEFISMTVPCLIARTLADDATVSVKQIDALIHRVA